MPVDTPSQPVGSVVASWRVAIIDDVYAGPTIGAVEDGLAVFCAEVGSDDERATQLKELTDCDFVDPAKVTDDAVGRLYDKRAQIAELTDQIDVLFLSYTQRRTEVDTIAGYLRAQGCTPTCFHSIEGVFGGEPFQLVFLDLLLAKGDDHEAQELAKRIYKEFNAFILLMSNSPGAKSPAQIEEFRRKTRLLSGFFHFCAKEELCDASRFQAQLETLPSDPKVCNAVHRLVIAIENALGGDIPEPESAEQENGGAETGRPLRQFMQTFRTLGLHDYALLCELTLRDEGHPLGDYLIRLLSSHLLGRLVADQKVRSAVGELDKLRFTEFLPFGDSSSPSFHRMYGDSTTEDVTDPWAPHPWSAEVSEQVGPAPAEVVQDANAEEDESTEAAGEEQALPAAAVDQAEDRPEPADILKLLKIQDDARHLPFLQLGDLLIHDDTGSAYAVLNAACDLQFVPGRISKERGDRPRDDTVLLLPGKLRRVDEATAPKSQTTAGLIEWKGGWYSIDWFDGKMLGLPHCIVRNLLEDQGYNHTRRLQTARALELQQAVLHKLSRIGLAVRPPLPRDVTLTLYGKTADLSFQPIGEPIVQGGLLFHGRKKEDRLIVLRQGAFYDCVRRMSEHTGTILKQDDVPEKVANSLPKAAAAFMARMVGLRRPIAVPQGSDVAPLKLLNNSGTNETVGQVSFRFGTFDSQPASTSKTKDIMFCLSAEEA